MIAGSGSVIVAVIPLGQMCDSGFRITSDDVEVLRERANGRASVQPLIHAYERWLSVIPSLDDAMEAVSDAFAEQKLGDGVGLQEATGIDDYACDEELARLRALDEHNDWRSIAVGTLERCHAAPTFMDNKGFVFHLPAFLIAELNDQHGYGFIDRLWKFDGFPERWFELLSRPQRDAIATVLELVAKHPDYHDNVDAIKIALGRYRDE